MLEREKTQLSGVNPLKSNQSKLNNQIDYHYYWKWCNM